MIYLEKRVALIIGDNDFNNVASRVVENIGISVENLDYNSSGINFLKDKMIPSLVILNYKESQPHLNEFIKFLNSNERIRSIPVIIYVSSAKEKDDIIRRIPHALLIIHPFISSVIVQNLKRLMKSHFGIFKDEMILLKQDERKEITGSLYGKMAKICETSCTVIAPFKVTKGDVANIGVKSDLFKKEGIEVDNFRGVDASSFVGDSQYETKFSLIGLNESEAQKIRMIINGNLYNKK